MKSSIQASNQFLNEINNLKQIQNSNCKQWGRHASELINSKQNILDQISKFQKVIEEFQNRVIAFEAQQKKEEARKNQKPRQKNFSSQVVKWCPETEKFKKRLHNVTQENIELTRVVQEMNKEHKDVSTQIDNSAAGPRPTSSVLLSKYTKDAHKSELPPRGDFSNGEYW